MTTKHRTKAKSVIESELETARQRIRDLEEQVATNDDEDEDEHSPSWRLSWFREQLDTLAVDVDTASAPKTFDQWRRCLQGMLRDEDWRHGTWR